MIKVDIFSGFLGAITNKLKPKSAAELHSPPERSRGKRLRRKILLEETITMSFEKPVENAELKLLFL